MRYVWLIALWGCVTTGPLKRAPGIVESVSYTPSRVVTGVGPALGGRGGVAVTTSTIPEKWVTVIRWMDGREPVVDETFSRSVRIGDTVWVEYAEILGRDSLPTGDLHVFDVVRR